MTGPSQARGHALPAQLQEELQSIVVGPTTDRSQRLDELCARYPQHAAALRSAAASPGATALDPHPAEPELPEAIGRYRILGLLGEGGMGAVYAAEQSEPVRRRVAVKVVKPGLDSKRVLARFEAERQALAMMSHPHITRVLDAGTTPDGRPYFVMEQVRGERLTEFCDKHRLALPARIALFQQVCSGVAHAHQRGIIHRDLKPSNILVELVEDKPVAKIIDFGVARALDQRLSEHTVYTEVGQMVGTLEYMSPEQAEMTIAEIDTRTDVYSLGVILYELLAGQLPFSRKELLEAGYAGMSRRLREVVPPKPSTRVTSATHDTDALARLRDARGQDYVRLLRGDLDWITMKALEKDRIRRYQSPLDLSADLQRFLDHEPVLAGPPSAWYRTSKFVRRHRVPVAAAAAVLVAVVGALSWSLVMLVKVEAARSETQEKGQQLQTERDAKERLLNDYRRVRDRQSAQDLVLAAESLWPETEQRAADMEAWLQRATEIAARGREVDALLTELRSRATVEHDKLRFADTDDQVRHVVLTDLARDLASVARLRPHVAQRLDWARQVEGETVTSPEARSRWAEAIADVAKDPRFQGHPLRPQLGLLPLGKNRQGLWEFAFPRSGRWVPPPYTQSRLTRETIQPECCIVFVLIPGGEFRMGAGPEDEGVETKATLDRYQRPTRMETVAPFFLAKFELSQHQWMQLAQAESNPSTYTARSRVSPTPDLSFPVDSVSWNECSRVLQHHDLELPGEVQWEYACRAGTETTWSCSAEDLKTHANLADQAAERGANSANGCEQWDDGCAFAAPPLQLRPNGFGLHHMHGNVAEWCRDLWHVYGQNPEQTQVQRILRGGAHNRGSRLATSAWRAGQAPDARASTIGVRPLREIR